MANKKLIKELESCGFVIGSLDILSKKLDNKYLCEYRVPTEELWISEDKSVLFTKMHQTFAQIAEKVLELTGVTLTPKQTKRQEIDKLFDLYDALKRDIATVRSSGNDNLLKIKRQHKRIDALEQGNQSQAQMIEDLQKSYPEPKSEPEKTEGVFKVGDPAVLSSIVSHYNQDIVDECKNQTVFIVSRAYDRRYCLANKRGVEFGDDSVYCFSERELQHAPKAFKVGDVAITLIDTMYIKEGSLVVITRDFKDGDFDIETKDGEADGTLHFRHLQHAPKEAAKVLEFGGWAETLVQMDSIYIGQRVLIVSNPDVDGEFLCTSGVPKNSEWYDPEQLKAL
jgi:hypothetical protein